MDEHVFGKRMMEHLGLGAAMGYAILHPASVVIHDLSAPGVFSLSSSIVSSFFWQHIYMALYFIVIGIAFGMVHGLNINRLAQLYAKVKKLSLTDELTGLYNRRYFDQSLAREQTRAERYGTEGYRSLSFQLPGIPAQWQHHREYWVRPSRLRRSVNGSGYY